jgi:hypothetical protein
VFPNKFDFIHGRALLSCFQNPEAVIQKAFDALAPGGYLEMQDGFFPMKYIGEPPVNSDLYKWNELVVECVAKSGRLWNNTLHYAKWMRDAGFEDVVEKNFYWPTSTWAKGEYYKKVATYFQEDMLNGVEGISMKIFTRFMGWTAEEVKAFLVGVKRDFRDRSIHAYLPMLVPLIHLQITWLIFSSEKLFMEGSHCQHPEISRNTSPIIFLSFFETCLMVPRST